MVIHWFLQDLRLHDNLGFFYACEASDAVLPLYIEDPTLKPQRGGASKWWLSRSLAALQIGLQELNRPFVYKEAEALKVFEALVSEYDIEAVYWNECFEPHYRTLQDKVERFLKEKGIAVYIYPSNYLYDFKDLQTQQGSYYKVYTQFWKKCLNSLTVRKAVSLPEKAKKFLKVSEKWHKTIEDYSPFWAKSFDEYWEPGEASARKRLTTFIKQDLKDYIDSRDIPSVKGTSKLSPAIHFGEISVVEIWHQVKKACQKEPVLKEAGNKFLSEIGWREFCAYLLYHNPDLPKKNFNNKFDPFEWKLNKKALTAWQKGLTGYPIVDAGMRELWQTGTMHNRVRMIVASFLTKDLLIHWKEGEKWFWDTLLDADLANNVGNWQWVAGCGADAAPFFRIFNPVLQGKRFDPDGDYVKQWVPELTALPKQYIHEPWEAPSELLEKAGVILGETYPERLVDHQAARDRALKAFKALRH